MNDGRESNDDDKSEVGSVIADGRISGILEATDRRVFSTKLI